MPFLTTAKLEDSFYPQYLEQEMLILLQAASVLAGAVRSSSLAGTCQAACKS